MFTYIPKRIYNYIQSMVVKVVISSSVKIIIVIMLFVNFKFNIRSHNDDIIHIIHVMLT